MGSPGAFESLGQALGRDNAKDILSGDCAWTSVLGIARPSREQRLIALVAETCALNQSLRAEEDVPEACKKAFAAGFLHEIERLLVRNGYQIHEFHLSSEECLARWKTAFDEGQTHEAAMRKMTLAMAQAIKPEADIVNAVGLLGILTASMNMWTGALRGANAITDQVSQATRGSRSGCLIPFVLFVSGAFWLIRMLNGA